ncbi:hypothetical protein TEA_026295 [Camellia sinensis var. sinensis]|uniref:Uncharacterized protein n=1 Tax=Camellia sinensis var. sinensis TaxID=542762 RepID=A0A4S4DCD2_CAMSN|nr:hypothetical protein TEA_026295 [Camellia sinensis var. sinensis]
MIIRYSSNRKKKNYKILSLSLSRRRSPMKRKIRRQQKPISSCDDYRYRQRPKPRTRTPYFLSSSLFPHPPSSLQSSDPPSLRTGKMVSPELAGVSLEHAEVSPAKTAVINGGNDWALIAVFLTTVTKPPLMIPLTTVFVTAVNALFWHSAQVLT